MNETEEVLSLQEATILAAAMDKKLKAFQRISEVLQVAAGAQAIIDKRDDELKVLEDRVQDGEEELKFLLLKADEARQDYQQQIAEGKVRVAETIQNEQDQIKASVADLQNQVKLVQGDLRKEMNSLEAFVESATEERMAIQEEIQRLGGMRDQIKDQLAAMAQI